MPGQLHPQHAMHPASSSGMVTEVRRAFVRFAKADSGQDLIEYALLAAFIGIAGWVFLMTIDEAAGTAYMNWLNPNSGAPSHWEPAEPLGS